MCEFQSRDVLILNRGLLKNFLEKKDTVYADRLRSIRLLNVSKSEC